MTTPTTKPTMTDEEFRALEWTLEDVERTEYWAAEARRTDLPDGDVEISRQPATADGVSVYRAGAVQLILVWSAEADADYDWQVCEHSSATHELSHRIVDQGGDDVTDEELDNLLDRISWDADAQSSDQLPGPPEPEDADAGTQKTPMRIVATWTDDGETYPVNKIECCTDGSVRLVWIEDDGESLPRDVFKDPGRLDVRRANELPPLDYVPEAFVVRRDGAANLQFRGELVAEASSSPDRARSGFSGNTGRWTELALYRTVGGNYVCSQIGRTQWQGEHDRRDAVVCADAVSVVEYFGHGWLAKELYAAAGIEDAETID